MRLKQRALPRCQSESRTNKSLMSLSRQGIDIVVDRVICRGGRDNNNSRRCSIVYPPSSGARCERTSVKHGILQDSLQYSFIGYTGLAAVVKLVLDG
ncbi:hypothetical protein J6590_105869 [Homalodisca vitripennis]|nr:hypothetical protein J6590_105869 [Homalodisca vitripennis]